MCRGWLFLVSEAIDLVKKLVLESANPGISAKKDRFSRLQSDNTLAKQLLNGSLRDFLDLWYKQPLFASFNNKSNYKTLIKKKCNALNPSQLATAITRFSQGIAPNLWPLIPKITIPCTYLCGELDTKYVKIGHQIKAKNKNIALQIQPGKGHNLHS